MEVRAGGVDVNGVEEVLWSCGEAETDTSRQELGERVEAQHMSSLWEEFGLELKVGGDEVLREVVVGVVFHHEKVVLLHHGEDFLLPFLGGGAAGGVAAYWGGVDYLWSLLAFWPGGEDLVHASCGESLVVYVYFDAFGSEEAEGGQDTRVNWGLDEDGVAGVENGVKGLSSVMVRS